MMTKQNILNFFIAILATTTLTTACVKDQTQEDPSFGQEYSVEQVSDALNEVYKDEPAAQSISCGETIETETFTNIESLPSILVEKRKAELIDIQETADTVTFSFCDNQQELVNGKLEKTHAVSEKTYQKPKSINTTLSTQSNSAKDFIIASSLKTMSESDGKPDRITYHNLKTVRTGHPVPEAVKLRPDCGGLPERICQTNIPVVQVAFDQVAWYGTKTKKLSILVQNSAQLPLLYLLKSTDLTQCIETVQSQGSQIFKLRQCSDTVDFSFGDGNCKLKTDPQNACGDHF